MHSAPQRAAPKPRSCALAPSMPPSTAARLSTLAISKPPWPYGNTAAPVPRLLFDTAPIDPTARRISQALDVTPEGLSRVQIRALFNRHVSKERIDLALEQLMTLGLINCKTSAGRGRPATLWAKLENPETVTGPETYGA